ncbi:MAG: hypothetical protein HY886_03105 [Deltaproteobacteria bacterium]|nr:hypothetical protein [Deltaproteobacteria bacterium]
MTNYVSARLGIFDALVKKRLDILDGRPWLLEPSQLRFRHGDTLADLKIPYHLGGEDDAVIEKAVLSLIALFMKRYEYAGKERRSEPDSRQPLAGFSPTLRDRTYRTDMFIADSLEKRTAEEILALTPYADSAMLSVWLSGDGHGRRFLKWASGMFDKALKDEARAGSGEPTSYLAMLAMVVAIRKKKDKAKEFKIKGLSYDKAELAIGLIMFASLRSTVLNLFETLAASHVAYHNPSSMMLMLSALSPKSFIAIPSNLTSTSLNPYGVGADAIEAVATVMPPLSGTAEQSVVVESTYQKIINTPAVMDAVKQQCEISVFRAEASRYLCEVDCPGSEAHAQLFDIYYDDRLIKQFLSDSKTPLSFAKALDDVKRQFIKDLRRTEIIASFQKYLTSFKKTMFDVLLGGDKKDSSEAIEQVIAGVLAARFDDHVEVFQNLMRGYTADRREEFDNNTLLEEYNNGRLYRFSSDDRPILKVLSIEAEGQLFIDMKDFTRRTFKVKEIAMADFMKEYFYKPILKAASRYKIGSDFVSDENGIRLTNMPGDAAIFSGGIENLVNLAKDIQHIIRGYRQQLLRKLPPGSDSGIIEAVHQNFEAKRAAFKKRHDELNMAADRKEAGIEAKIIALGEEEHRLENTYRDELEAAVKNELEAGLYISFGSKSETAIIEGVEEFAGTVKVAIGEKINEAARGTFRHPLVRAKLELLLENERLVRDDKTLAYPFDIYIDRIYSLRMPPELDRAFERLVLTRKQPAAEAMYRIMANEYMSDLKKIVAGDTFASLRLISSTTDLYNKGQAISAAALDAYMKETRATKRFFKKVVQPAALAPEIRNAFFFPVTPLEFIFAVEKAKGMERIEGFYKAGEVVFKGFEATGPVTVYEMLYGDSSFMREFLNHHVRQWAKDAEGEAVE